MKAISIFCCLLVIGCAENNQPINKGGDVSGGGGFYFKNSKALLEVAITNLGEKLFTVHHL